MDVLPHGIKLAKNNPMLSPNQARIQSFRVVPALPEPLKALSDIAHNLWWSWNYEAVNLFSRLDRDLWESTGHNPVLMLGSISQEKLDRAASDRSFVHALGSVHNQLIEHMQHGGWFAEAGGALSTNKPFKVAYFCSEFGLTECFQIYSGGLGCLAGDHLKSAADLAIPLVGVGLLYRRGYFHQYLSPDGFQQETYPDIDAPNQPITKVIDKRTSQQLRVSVELPGRTISLGVWRCDVGKVPLYLLDANLPENSREDRDITSTLYGGDIEHRIKQEIVLGVGGVRALKAIGEDPSVFHCNEGHASFLTLERIHNVRAQHPDLTFDQAREAIGASCVFTTHTPVPAGIDRFPPRLIETYLSHMCPGLGLDLEGLLALGRENTADRKEFFSMAVLAIRTARFCNAVSELHGHVSRGMWKQMWPGTPEADVPIGHVTNGVHARSWVSADLSRLFDRYLGIEWHDSPEDAATWNRIDEIPDEELWAAHQRRREHLIAWVRRKIRAQLTARGAGMAEIDAAAAALDTNVLTIGFARRFATYKRGTLLFRDKARLDKLLTSGRPIQLLIAGKSHPADGGGKQLIRDIVEFSRQGKNNLRVVFLEDYDIQVGRRLVQGCDVWLNNPIRGLEASGTSGMKAAMNGCLNCSILDGWWDEGFDPETGFAIGRGENYDERSRDDMDDIESRALYQVLEGQVVPMFYDRDSGGIPRKWVSMMKGCIRSLAPAFNTHRMVIDYARKFYFAAHNAAQRLATEKFEQARDLAVHLDRYRHHWHKVRVLEVSNHVGPNGAVPVRGSVGVQARVSLGDLFATEVRVELYHGRVNSLGELTGAQAIPMKHDRDMGDGTHTFVGAFAPNHSGQHGYSVRVLPEDDRLVSPIVPGLITWDTGVAPPESIPAVPTPPPQLVKA
ncbi:MAG: alpha-glucan family phosphorylase [Phycisphaerales bacterium]